MFTWTAKRVARRLLIFAAAAGALGFAAFWLLTVPAVVPASALGPHTPDLANGRTLFFAGNCAACHARPGQDDQTNLGGGMALETPPGTFYIPNISPDPNDGIGRWTEAQFVTALTKGTAPDGSHYYPAFPYTSFTHVSVDDLRDMFAYIKTLPPAAGRIRPHDLPFPFTIRRPIGLWKLLFLHDEPFKPDPARSAQWNRGAYLVNGPDHCAECHSPHNVFAAVKQGQRFAGGTSLEGQGFVPNITQARLGDWSADDIAALLKTGLTPHGDRIGSAMTPVIRNIGQLPDEDRSAIAVYVKSLPPIEGPPRPDGK